MMIAEMPNTNVWALPAIIGKLIASISETPAAARPKKMPMALNWGRGLLVGEPLVVIGGVPLAHEAALGLLLGAEALGLGWEALPAAELPKASRAIRAEIRTVRATESEWPPNHGM